MYFRLEIIPLFDHSVQQHSCGPLLRVDVSHLVVHDTTVLEKMYDLFHKNQQRHIADERDEPGMLSDTEFEDFQNLVMGHTFMTRYIYINLSSVMRKLAFHICENKDADQLCGNRTADQCLCFRYTDSTIALLPKSENSSL